MTEPYIACLDCGGAMVRATPLTWMCPKCEEGEMAEPTTCPMCGQPARAVGEAWVHYEPVEDTTGSLVEAMVEIKALRESARIADDLLAEARESTAHWLARAKAAEALAGEALQVVNSYRVQSGSFVTCIDLWADRVLATDAVDVDVPEVRGGSDGD